MSQYQKPVPIDHKSIIRLCDWSIDCDNPCVGLYPYCKEHINVGINDDDIKNINVDD